VSPKRTYEPQWKPEPRPKAAPKRLRGSHGNRVPKPTVTALAKRAGWCCEARTPDCWGSPEHPHHRRAKGPGGPDHRLLNLVAACGGCHRAIHARPDWSYRHGFLLAAGDDPELLVVGCSFDCMTDHRGDHR
jgi:hypothetical protein